MKVTLTTPNVSTNRLYTTSRYTGKRILSSVARETKGAWGYEAKNQYKRKPIKVPIEVWVVLYLPDYRRRDVDNIKALLDSMTNILWEDDSLIYNLHISKVIDQKKPRIEISFEVIK